MAGNAGGLSYSGLINSGKLTLPSVDSWGTNMNILRDPPKSIHTRRIDKVGETSAITSMIDDSSNRACEAISYYSRGLNPSVSVDYGNAGNNGGQRSGGMIAGGQTQAKLPYRILQDGQFRPPVLRQEQLMPLSRLPRVWTEALTNPEFIDHTKRLRNCGTAEETKEVHNSTLKVCARPTAVYKIEKPLTEPFEIKYVIQNPVQTSATSGIRTMDRTSQHVQEPTKGVDQNNLHVLARTNISDVRHVDNNDFDANPYLQNTNHSRVVSNVNSHAQITPIDQILDLSDIRTKNTLHTDYKTPVSGVEQTNYIHDDIDLQRILPEYNARTNISQNKHVTYIHDDVDLQRTLPEYNARTNISQNKHVDYIHEDINLYRTLPEYNATTNISQNERTDYIHDDINLSRRLPEYNATTNIGQNIHKRIEHDNSIYLNRNIPHSQVLTNQGSSQVGVIDTTSSRNYHLAPKVNPGGFDGRGSMPLINRTQEVGTPYESQKSRMGKAVMAQFEGRYDSLPPRGFD